MNKYKQFIEFFDYLVANCREPVELPEEVRQVYDVLRVQETREKPLFTEAGLEILEYLQKSNIPTLRAKDIAEGLGVSSRKVSGAIRKLCSDGYVNKIDSSPVIYELSTKGKEFNIEKYKESLNNEESHD